MSMRYFTLSAVCMLIFCMLLALIGTTDFPGSHQGIVSPSVSVFPAQDSSLAGTGEAMASVVPLPGDSGPQTPEDIAPEAAPAGVARNRPLLFLGVFFVAAWVLLSFKLFTRSKG